MTVKVIRLSLLAALAAGLPACASALQAPQAASAAGASVRRTHDNLCLCVSTSCDRPAASVVDSPTLGG